MNKLVSIVLPTYNGSAYLRESIESCLNQTYENLELIVVNDCSTDDTETIVKSFKDKRLRYHENTVNQKLPKSLNIGFELALGEYYTWTSDDNLFDVLAIEKMVNSLEERSVDLVYAPYYVIDMSGNVKSHRAVSDPERILVENIVRACFLYKKEVHKRLDGYNHSRILVEDYDFWIRTIYEGFHVYKLNETLYYYRFHEDSLTETKREEISSSLYDLLVFHEYKFSQKDLHFFLSYRVYLNLSRLAISNKHSGIRYFRRAFLRNPFIIFNRLSIKLILIESSRLLRKKR